MGGGRLHRLKPPLSWGYCKLSRRRKQNGVQDRAKWLQTAANIFDLINKGEGGIKIDAAMAQRSPRPNDGK